MTTASSVEPAAAARRRCAPGGSGRASLRRAWASRRGGRRRGVAQVARPTASTPAAAARLDGLEQPRRAPRRGRPRAARPAAACARHLLGGVGDVHDRGRASRRPCRRRRRSRAGSPAGCPTTTTRSASPNAVPRARVTSSGCPGGRTPRPMPLAMTGSPGASTKRRAAVLGAVGPHVRAEHEHRALRVAEQARRLVDGRRGRPRPAGRPRPTGAAADVGVGEQHVHRARRGRPGRGAGRRPG